MKLRQKKLARALAGLQAALGVQGDQGGRPDLGSPTLSPELRIPQGLGRCGRERGRKKKHSSITHFHDPKRTHLMIGGQTDWDKDT